MAKRVGFPARIHIDGYELTGDVGALNEISTPRAVLDVTDISKAGIERLLGHGDGMLEFLAFFNDAGSQMHSRMKLLPTTDVDVTFHLGDTIGSPGFGLRAKQINYDWRRATDGSLLGTVRCEANGTPLEWGVMLTAGRRTDTAATNGASQDNAASSASGLAGWLQVFSFTGTSVTLTIQESSDDGGLDPWAAKLTFAAASAVGTQRVTATGTVERYLRVASTGTFTNALFTVLVRRGTAQDQEAY